MVILVDHHGPSYLLAIEKATGRNLWKIDRPSQSSWTTPVVTQIHGRQLVLVSSGGSLAAYDAGTGKQLWIFEGLQGNTIPSPTVWGDLVLVGAGEDRLKPDSAASAQSNCCLRLTDHQESSGCELVWRGTKIVSHHASPVIHAGQAYFVTRSGIVHCLDVQTGAQAYAERLADACWATPIAAGEHVYFFGKDGVTTVLRAGPTFERVATNRLWTEEAFQKRKDVERSKPENQLPPRSDISKGKGKGRPPSPPSGESEERRYDAVGDVVYGVAAVSGAFFIRTGTELYCVGRAR